MAKLLNGITINRELIADYFIDCWGEDFEDYRDWSSSELIQLIRDMGYYEDFEGYVS